MRRSGVSVASSERAIHLVARETDSVLVAEDHVGRLVLLRCVRLRRGRARVNSDGHTGQLRGSETREEQHSRPSCLMTT